MAHFRKITSALRTSFLYLSAFKVPRYYTTKWLILLFCFKNLNQNHSKIRKRWTSLMILPSTTIFVLVTWFPTNAKDFVFWLDTVADIINECILIWKSGFMRKTDTRYYAAYYYILLSSLDRYFHFLTLIQTLMATVFYPLISNRIFMSLHKTY